VNHHAVPVGLERPVSTEQRFRRRPLQEGPGLLIEDGTHEVIRRRVADIELYCGVEGGEID
jgi:hypothetical protein